MESGAVMFQGTFKKVRENIPNFDYQAGLMGL
jgi:hypothetical protein